MNPEDWKFVAYAISGLAVMFAVTLIDSPTVNLPIRAVVMIYATFLILYVAEYGDEFANAIRAAKETRDLGV